MGRSRMLLVRNADFRRLFVAELVVFGGDWFVMIPLLARLGELTGSGLWGGLVLAVDTGLIALLLPYAGTVADRLDRKKIMMTGNLVAVAAFAVLLAVRSGGLAWLALVAIGTVAVAKAFYMPAAQAALPNVVDAADLPTANAISGSAWGTMLVVGASLGGLLAAAVGPYTCFVVGCVCLALAALLTWRVRRPFQAARGDGPHPHPLAAVREALAYIGHRPRVLALVTVKSAVGLGNGVLAVFPILAASVYHVGTVGLGLLFAARGLGAMTGPIVLRRWLSGGNRLLTGLAVSMAGYGIAYLGVGLSPWYGLALALVAAAHFAGGGNWVLSNFALQAEVPDGLRGRIFSADLMLAMLAVSLSQAVAGVLTDHVDPKLLVGCFGAVTLTYSLFWRLATVRLRNSAGL